MTATTPLCGVCEQPCPDGALCHPCTATLHGHLRGVPDLLAELDVTITRQDRHRPGTGASRPDTDTAPGDEPALGVAAAALPVNVGAVWRHGQLTHTVWAAAGYVHATWPDRGVRPGTPPPATPAEAVWRWLDLRDITRTWPGPPFVLPRPHPPATAADAALWLTGYLPSIRTQPWAPRLADQLAEDTRHALAVIDRPDDRIRITCPTCDTPVPMTPDPHDGTTRDDGTPHLCPGCVTTTCPNCGATGEREWWIDNAAPPTEPVTLARLPLALYGHGYTLTHHQLRQWADRGRLDPARRGLTPQGARQYDPVTVALIAGRARTSPRG